jgi:hypothetical protein
MLEHFHKVDKDYGARLEAAVNKRLAPNDEKKLVLEYFPVAGKALQIRLALEYLGVPYTDKLLGRQEFYANKAAGKYRYT